MVGVSDPTALGEILMTARGTVRAALAESAERRARVLRHDDLAALLKAKPLEYKRPDQWNGYVPPALMPEDSDGLAKRNDSPRRAALVELSAEAWRREHERVPS